jgi:hypothetical protein
MKYVCPPGMVWRIARRLGRVKQTNLVFYSWPGRPRFFYVRRYVVPRNPRTPAQAGMRRLFGVLSRDWFGLLTPPQRDAWTAYARNLHRRWGAAWIDHARQLNCCWPHTLTAYDRRMIRRWLVGGRPLTGPQAYVKINTVLGRIGRPKLFWPPPPPVPLRPNPVQEVRLRHLNPNPTPNLNPVAAAVPPHPSDHQSPITNHKSPINHQPSTINHPPLRLELVLPRHLKCDLLLFGSAPCSAGWSNMRRPVYLGVLPSPSEGVHDLTALYLARFRAPEPNEQVFIRVCQHRHGWESPPQDLSALLPPKPPGSREARDGSEEELSLLGLRPLRATPFGCGSAPQRLCLTPLPPLHTPSSPRPHTPCTRGARLPRASATADRSRCPQFVSIREIRLCHRRQCHCRELWRGT